MVSLQGLREGRVAASVFEGKIGAGWYGCCTTAVCQIIHALVKRVEEARVSFNTPCFAVGCARPHDLHLGENHVGPIGCRPHRLVIGALEK